MTRKNDLALLRGLLHSGIDVMTQMPLAAEWLRRLVPSFSLSMIRVNESCAPQEHYSEFFDDFSHQLFAEQGHLFAASRDDPAAFGNLLRARVPYGNLIDSPEAFLKGATYEHLFQRNGIHHVLDVAIRDESSPLAILGIFRERDAPAFTRSDVATVREFYSALVHAFRAEPLPADFDETDSAVILTRPDGAIDWATPSARWWLEDAARGPERAGLSTKNLLPEACRALTKSLLRGGDATLSLPVPGGRLRLRAYGTNQLAGGPEGPIAIFLRLEMHRQLKMHWVLSRHRLTPQQRRIALCYLAGKKPEQICQELSLTPATLKSYQKDLYARLEVRSSAELVDLLESQAKRADLDLKRHLPKRRQQTT